MKLSNISSFVILMFVIFKFRNVKRPIFRHFKIANIKITKDELFDNFIFEYNFLFFRNNLHIQNIKQYFKL